MENQDVDLNVMGRLASLNVLVAFAIATATREHDDPRGAAFDVISAAEEELAETIANVDKSAPAHVIAKLGDAARRNTMSVGVLVDAFLKSMGASPRESE
ncbi:hypothetical protein BI317_15750 [Xanthomonas hortorum pv. gardneri]|uniref:hypothetical protein n=1 Tax=Xanthomonas hortorum TaxID=56454 RepID=UPI00093835E7|nr:hypothetical protein [Xanthomonas hortorum]APP85407.1 hypothetical protein BI317_15750 [Xanthomonas hortorum pv. gardneri]